MEFVSGPSLMSVFKPFAKLRILDGKHPLSLIFPHTYFNSPAKILLIAGHFDQPNTISPGRVIKTGACYYKQCLNFTSDNSWLI